MKLTNKNKVPARFFKAYKLHQYDGIRNKLESISVSALLDAPRKRLLTIRHWEELEEDINNKRNSIIGTAIHEYLRKLDSRTYQTERRKEIEVDGLIVSGQADGYDPTKKTIYDTKTPTDRSFKRTQLKLSWIQQLNCYRAIWVANGLPVDKLKIDVMLQNHDAHRVGTDNYPETDMFTLNVPVWELKQAEKFIKERVAYHKKFETTDDDELPVCTKKERLRSDDIYKIYKNENKKASFVSVDFDLVLKKKEELESLKKPNDVYRIKHFAATDHMCLRCNVNRFCNYFKETYGQKEEADRNV